MSEGPKELLTRLIDEEAQRRLDAPPIVKRPEGRSRLVTAAMVLICCSTFTAAVITTTLAYRKSLGPAAVQVRLISAEELSEYVPVASVQTDGHHLTIRVTDDWIRRPREDRDLGFKAICYGIADRYYHSANIEDLQGNTLARWHGGMVELLR